jgi:flagellar motor switch protein FliG
MACLSGVHADQIAGVLAREQPAVIAIVLRYLSADKAGEVIGLLPSEVRKKVVVFLCTAATPSPEVVGRIEAYLSTRLGQGKRSHKVDENNKLEVVTNILQSVDRSVEEELLTAIDDSSETLGNTIRDKLFTFEDIVKLNDVAMRRILQEVDTAGLAIALRSASIDLREKFFRNMSKRSAEALKEEMQFSQKVKLSDVEAKQKEVVNIIRGLDAQGQISIGEEKADEYV